MIVVKTTERLKSLFFLLIERRTTALLNVGHYIHATMLGPACLDEYLLPLALVSVGLEKIV